MGYLFWKRNKIEDPDLDISISILWYIWKARNDNFFRGIDMNPLEIVRITETECLAWFEANKFVDVLIVSHQVHQVSASKICLVDCSWMPDSLFSGTGWTWKNTIGENQFLGVKNQMRRISPLHSEVEALICAMECMLQSSNFQSFGTDSRELVLMVLDPDGWPNLSTKHKELLELKSGLQSRFSISHIHRSLNVTSDSLDKIARSVHNNLYYIGCSVPVLLPRPTQT